MAINILHTKQLILPVLAISAIIAISNYLVRFAVNDWLTWAAFTYPICFLITDLCNRFFGVVAAKKLIWCGFAFGVVLSVALATPRIAIASASAFLCSQMLDVYIFDRLRNSAWWRAPLVSSAAGSLVDTLLFFSIAFAFSDVPWVSLALGDFAAKVAMFVLLLPAYRVVCTVVQKIYGDNTAIQI